MEFTKGHGTGNDFVIVADPDNQRPLTDAEVAAVCHRRFGVGGDGVLRVVRTTSDPDFARYAGDPSRPAEWFMDYRNADGSVAEMCGNGVRVFARYLAERGLVGSPAFVVGTRSGPVPVEVTDEAVSVYLPPPRLDGRGEAVVAGERFTGTAVDCGNPHLVCSVRDAAALAAVDLSGPPVTDSATFPRGVNVELVAPLTADERVRMRVYERGVGETWSCGSGAVAAAAAVRAEVGDDRGLVTVEIPGGVVTVALTGDAAVLTGPAVLVAHGVATVPTPVAAASAPGG